ncbi:UNVERIFIED_ORG: protein-tyrosine-phosphatase [Pseudomonas lini]|uniref:ArsR family transcriptional regulator n=1 Tax=Pseudomonas viciae TaxID=2505979 RepID=A0A4V1CAK4_9PSED|nr:ArsR family transcriptional regulator [Pseudomonas viciae]
MTSKARVLFVCTVNAARSQSRPDAFRHTLHEIHERIKMFVLVKTKR